MSSDLDAGKVERMVQQNQYHICAYYFCFSSISYTVSLSYKVDEIETCKLVDFHHNTS